MKKFLLIIKRSIKKLFICLYFLSSIIGDIEFEPVRAKAASSKTAPRYLIENVNYIKQNYTRKGMGFLQTIYKNSTGKTFVFSRPPRKGALPDGILPVAYDLRTEKRISPIKDQKNTGCCWSFATLKSLESHLMKSDPSLFSQIDLSENHLAWYLYHPPVKKEDTTWHDGITFNKSSAKKNYQNKSASFQKKYSFQTYYNTLPYINGGNTLFGTSILARWSGAISEKKAPFTAETQKLLSRMGNQMNASSEKLRNLSEYMLTDAICYDEAERTSIKRALMEYGALGAALYYDKSWIYNPSQEGTAYFQKKYIENATAHANHCVNIAGWDDNYPKENFLSPPQNNGAWLIANSYGTAFGEQGYFWVSYEEPSLVDLYSIRGEKKKYDHNYQYDGSGWTIALAPQTETGSKAANLFTADIEYTQNLEAVSFYTATNHQPYTITIYVDAKKGAPESGKRMLTLKGTQEYRGYHTITLPKKIFLKPGQRFSVILSMEHTTETNGYLPVEGIKSTTDDLCINFSSKDGESYYYACVMDTKTRKSTCRWADLNQTAIRTSSASSGNIYHNVCIKAFTTNIKYIGKIQFSIHKLILKKNEKKNLTLSLKKVANPKVTYTNSKKSIAILKNPKSNAKKSLKKISITAKKKGKTKITATLPNGTSDRLIVIVR